MDAMPPPQLQIIVDPEFKDYLGPLDDESRQALEASLKQEGCRDGLVIWRQGENTAILLDGHNRHELCAKHDIPFWTINCPETVVDRHTALAWIVENQRARRNLTPREMKNLIGAVYERRKRIITNPAGVNQREAVGGQIDHQPPVKTESVVAKEFGVSPRTVRRAAEFHQAVTDISAKHGPEAKAEILTGRKKVLDFVAPDEVEKVAPRVEPDIKTENHPPIPECQTVAEIVPGAVPPTPPPPKVTRGNIEAGVLLTDGLSIILAKLDELSEVGMPDRKSLPAILQSIEEAETHLRDLSRALTEGVK